MSRSLKELKTLFLEYLEIEKGRSLKTVTNYDRYLTRFFTFAKLEKPEDISEEAIRTFRLNLNRSAGRKERGQTPGTMKKNTQNYYLIALRTFLKFLMKRDITSLTPDRIELAKVAERNLDLISAQELDRLLKSPDETSVKGLRDRAILELIFSTGLRVSELCSLNRDLDLSKDETSVRGKGEKVRVVFLSPSAKQAVKRYLAKRTDMDGALFVQVSRQVSGRTQKNSSLRITTRSIERLVKQHAINAGIGRKVTPHIIRHSFATDLLENGADIRSVQQMLGHANIATTQIYTHLTDKHLREVHKAFHGRRRK